MPRIIPFASLLLAASLLGAAEHNGKVSSAGRPVPGSTVTAVQGDRKLVTVTDEAGRYSFEDLGPGIWTFHVEMFGFVPLEHEVEAGAEPSTAEWTLELKPYEPAAGTPPPSELPPVVELESAPDPDAPQESEANAAFLINGSLSRGLEVAREEDLLAGPPQAPVIVSQPKGEKRAAAKPDKALKVKPARAARAPKAKGRKASIAAFGNRRKKDENGIRGSVFFSLRNSALDARPFSLTGQLVPKPSYAQNRFGATLGGPLHIPGLPARARTSFSLNYSGTRSRNPFDAVATLPSPSERLGDFSQSVVRGPVTILDPAGRLPFPENRIPADRFDRAASGLLEFIPLANQPGRIHNYQFLSSVRQNTDNLNARLNQPLSRRNRVSFSLNLQRRNGDGLQSFGFRDQTRGFGWKSDLAWNLNFGRRVINSLRGNINRNRSENVPFFAFERDVAGELGILGTSREAVNFGPPNLSFTNFGDLSDASPVLRRDQDSTVSDGLTLLKGKHNLTFGGEYQRRQLNSRTDQNARGSFSFSGLATSGLDERGQPLVFSGFDFADFLLGLPQSSSVRFGSANTYFRGTGYAIYGQDDWRLRRNLTINGGVRYEFFPPLREKFGRMANLDVAGDFTGAAAVTPRAVGPFTGPFGDALIDPDRNNISPRIGIAWRPFANRGTQVRLGYGAFYDGSIYQRFATRLASQPPFASTAHATTSLARPLTIRDGLTAVTTAKVTNTFAVDRAYRVGYAQTWNFAVQQELPNGLVLELGYLGTKGAKLDIQRSPNRAAPGSPLTAEQRRRIGNAVGFTWDSSEGNSIYHAAQVRLTRRFRKGMAANALYTWSKSIDNASSIGGGGNVVAQNDRDLSAERGLSSFDQRHALTLNYLLSSPSGPRGRVPRVLRNWTLTGGLTLRAGQPFTARVLGNRADSGGTGVVGSGRADATGENVNGDGFFNGGAFTIPPSGRFGNAGRNTIPGPGYFALNLSIGRSFRFGESRRWLEVRAESNNATNHVNYSGLGTVVNASNYGLATRASAMRTVSAQVRYRF